MGRNLTVIVALVIGMTQASPGINDCVFCTGKPPDGVCIPPGCDPKPDPPLAIRP